MATDIEIADKRALARVEEETQPANGLMAVVAQLAQNPNADIARIKELVELHEGYQERRRKETAEQAFNEAFAAFKSESVRIVKNTKVAQGPLEGKRYANLFGVIDEVVPAMSKHGLSHSWRLSTDKPDWMEVTCTLRHKLGHFIEVAMGAASDTGPGRNAIQARGSAKSYLERYTFLAITGLAAADDDNDGAGAPDPTLEPALKRIRAAQDPGELQKVFAEVYKAAKEAKNERSMKALIDAKDVEKAKMQ